MDTVNLSDFLTPGHRCHLVGIGGVSMSPLAEVLNIMGLIVSGSDMKESDTTKNLISKGINVIIGHDADNIKGAGFVIRTSAAHDDNVEVYAAREQGIPVFERADAWGELMRAYENAVCIAGTHGKTTTTSMVTHIMLAAGRDPTVMIGGTLPLLQSNYRIGNGSIIVLESDEYYNSFHRFFPTIAVILNIDRDHPDFFSGIDEIKASFRKFASLVPEDGFIVYNRDDANTADTISVLERKALSFGIGKDADLQAKSIINKRQTVFDLYYHGEFLERITLRVPGMHNVYNALAASAAAIAAGVPASAIKEGLGGFNGTKRRLEYKGSYNGADIYDDYAHHPTELKALLGAVSVMGYSRVLCAFQPHTFSRTRVLFDDFVTELKAADIVYLAEVFAARESDAHGISSSKLAAQIPNAVYCADFSAIQDQIKKTAREGDIILTVGAGDIYKVGENLLLEQEG